jgi:hypothetical protein
VSTNSENSELPSARERGLYRVFKHLPTFKPSARNSKGSNSRLSGWHKWYSVISVFSNKPDLRVPLFVDIKTSASCFSTTNASNRVILCALESYDLCLSYHVLFNKKGYKIKNVGIPFLLKSTWYDRHKSYDSNAHKITRFEAFVVEKQLAEVLISTKRGTLRSGLFEITEITEYHLCQPLNREFEPLGFIVYIWFLIR